MAKPKLVSKPNKRQQFQQRVRAAIPEVRALCERHGTSVISSCVTRIAQYDKKMAQVEKLRAEAARLEQKLMAEDQEGRVNANTELHNVS